MAKKVMQVMVSLTVEVEVAEGGPSHERMSLAEARALELVRKHLGGESAVRVEDANAM